MPLIGLRRLRAGSGPGPRHRRLRRRELARRLLELRLGWEPIGTYYEPFQAVFDGTATPYRNLFINRASDHVGLFGYLNASATVVDVKLVDVAVSTRGPLCGRLGRKRTSRERSAQAR